MADEITVSCRLAVSTTTYTISDAVEELATQFDMSGSERIDTIISIGTSEEALPFGDVATAGWCFCKNLDATNYIQIRGATGATALIKMLPGEWALFRMAASAPYAIANSAACRMRFVLFEA